ncbi:hypothetical protein [Nannocystis pusilla]|uniref:hypothetical protein n=1 Tax=Nannocystis pusilla TaxID=889268 RepID=UPI003B77AA35
MRTASSQVAGGGPQTASTQLIPAQSVSTTHAEPSAHPGQAGPPQSTSVSLPFCWPSSHDSTAPLLVPVVVLASVDVDVVVSSGASVELPVVASVVGSAVVVGSPDVVDVVVCDSRPR